VIGRTSMSLPACVLDRVLDEMRVAISMTSGSPTTQSGHPDRGAEDLAGTARLAFERFGDAEDDVAKPAWPAPPAVACRAR